MVLHLAIIGQHDMSGYLPVIDGHVIDGADNDVVALIIILAHNFHAETGPTDEELHILRTEIDPLGIRRLEFIPSRERTALIEELLTAEEAAIQELCE